MTARTVGRAAAAQEYSRAARGRRGGSSCSAGCRIAHESRNDIRTGGCKQREARRRIDIGTVYALMPQQTLSTALFGENGEAVADVYLQPVHEHGVSVE